MLFKPSSKLRFTTKVQAALYKKGVRHAFDTWIVYKVNPNATLMLYSSRALKTRKSYCLTVDADRSLFDLQKSV
jgi:hypothetical protein